MKRLSKEEQARAHLCIHPGCDRPWTCDFGRGKVCSEHDQPAKSVVPVPSIDPVPSWHDTDRDDEEAA